MATKAKPPVKTVTEEARARLQLCIDADGGNRAAAMDDLKFAAGDQWPAEIKMQRMLDRRPCLTINKTDTFVRSVVNNMRQQRPRIKVHPVADGADQQVSEVIEGLIRHIEVSSNADTAYDTAADFQVRMGWGFVRILAKYSDEKSWDQDLYIDRVRNPFSVYFDPASTSPDGLDGKFCFVIEPMKKVEFEAKYHGKTVSDFKTMGDELSGYAKRDEVLVAEYFRIDEKADTLCRLTNGESHFLSDLPNEATLHNMGLQIVDRRDSMKTVVKWSKLSGNDELETRDLPGKYLWVLPVYGAELLEGDNLIRYGMVRNLKDPQKMYNFWRTSETEFVALAPKAPWLMAEGQDEGHEDEWNSANVKNFSSLKYKPISDDNGQMLPPPMRQQPQAVPAASVNAAMAASEDLKAVAGMFDPSLGAAGNETSGSMVSKRQGQSDLSNFHFYDNLTRTIRAVGIVLLDLIPHYYDTQRTIRIIGEDGNPKSTQINAPKPPEQQQPGQPPMDPQMQAVQQVLNDLTVGKYDVVMDTGPGYDTKREAGAENMMKLLSFLPEIGKVAGDMIVRQMDWPGANDLADRLAMANPLAKIDEQLPDDMDPKAKQMLAQAMGQIQTLTQQLQELTKEKDAKVFGVQMREQAITQRQQLIEDAETNRLHLREIGEDERAHIRSRTELENTDKKNETSLHETLIDATTNMEISHRQALQHGEPGGGHGDSRATPSHGGGGSEHVEALNEAVKQMAAMTKEFSRPRKRTIVRDGSGKPTHTIEE
jgi:hypothetical protein